MGQATVHYCDECGKLKQESNNWFVYYTYKTVELVGALVKVHYQWGIDNIKSGRWVLEQAIMSCGDGCGVKIEQRWRAAGLIRRESDIHLGFIDVNHGRIGIYSSQEDSIQEEKESLQAGRTDTNSSQHQLDILRASNLHSEVGR